METDIYLQGSSFSEWFLCSMELESQENLIIEGSIGYFQRGRGQSGTRTNNGGRERMSHESGSKCISAQLLALTDPLMSLLCWLRIHWPTKTVSSTFWYRLVPTSINFHQLSSISSHPLICIQNRASS